MSELRDQIFFLQLDTFRVILWTLVELFQFCSAGDCELYINEEK